MTRTILLAAALVAALALPTAATAVVPPKNCGYMTVKGKRYQIKADQLSCRTARDHIKRYISAGRKPSGYTCRRPNTEKGRVSHTCHKGRKNFFAIRR